MFACDFNLPYKETTQHYACSYSDRLEAGIKQMVQIPERGIMAIVNLAKTIFYAMLSAMTFGQWRLSNFETRCNFIRTIKCTGSFFLNILAFFTPLNCFKWNVSLDKWSIQTQKDICNEAGLHLALTEAMINQELN